MHVSDKMAEMMKNELDVKDCKITSTAVEDTCFVNIPEDEIKLENSGLQGKLDSSTLIKQRIHNSVTAVFLGRGGGRKYNTITNNITIFLKKYYQSLMKI